MKELVQNYTTTIQCAIAANKNPATEHHSKAFWDWSFFPFSAAYTENVVYVLFALFNFHALGWFRYRT